MFEQAKPKAGDGNVTLQRIGRGDAERWALTVVDDEQAQVLCMSEYNASRVVGILAVFLGIELPKDVASAIKFTLPVPPAPTPIADASAAVADLVERLRLPPPLGPSLLTEEREAAADLLEQLGERNARMAVELLKLGDRIRRVESRTDGLFLRVLELDAKSIGLAPKRPHDFRARRHTAGKTMGDAARALGWPTELVSDVERGRVEVTIEQAAAYNAWLDGLAATEGRLPAELPVPEDKP